ncbi:MAG TPA: TMEM175 family protein [Chthoniobacterales bacterium]|jgi:uncharacterized membrane protein
MADSVENQEKFTSRLEAFSDLVFGFSLSLLATRLDVPAKVENIYDPTRWLPIIGTFGLVCRFWLEHYRIFRHRFVAGMFDAVVNFVFLFAVAVLPYAVQTFLRFRLQLPAFALYLGDFAVIIFTLAILRVRGLRQRRSDPNLGQRLRDSRRSVLQFGISVLLVSLLLGLELHGGSVGEALRDLDVYVALAFLAMVVFCRSLVWGLPRFLV